MVCLNHTRRFVAQDEQSFTLGIVMQAGDVAQAAPGEAHQDGGRGCIAFRLGRDDLEDGRGAFFAGDKVALGKRIVRDALESVGGVDLYFGVELSSLFPTDAAVLWLELDEDNIAARLLGHGEPVFAQPDDALGVVELVEVDFALEGAVEPQFDDPLRRVEHDE